MADETAPLPCLIGAGGQVGRRLACAFAAAGQSWLEVGRAGSDLAWSMAGAPPDLPACRGRAVFVLAGAVPLSRQDMALNTTLARAGVAAARRWSAARCFVVSSSSVYGPTGVAPVSEDAPTDPRSPYARAKLDMEHATSAPDVTALRLANVAGASEPFVTLARSEVPVLDRFADGRGPMRSYIGPIRLAGVIVGLAALAENGTNLPPVLNVAAPGEVAMEDVFHAANRAFDWREAPATAAAHVHLDVSRLAAVVPLAPQDAATLLAESRATEHSR